MQLPVLSGPIPVTSVSRPFGAGGTAANFAAAGYIEEEYFQSGTANVYDWVGDGDVRVVAGPAPYVTRVLVRRPADPAAFSGKVDVEVLNASLSVDMAPTWRLHRDYIMRNGDVWIGITSKAVTAKALQRFDPERYASLNWNSPIPLAETCDHPSSIPEFCLGPPGTLATFPETFPKASFRETEDGLFWDMFAQLGALLKSPARSKVLRGFSAPHLFATGISQSGLVLRTWINGFHARSRLAEGAPIYDGYLVEVGPVVYRINQCAADAPLEDPRQRIAPPADAAVINLVSEGDMWMGAHTRQADVVSGRSGVVTYEVAGSSHGGGAPLFDASTEQDIAKALGGPLVRPPPMDPRYIENDFPRGALTSAALRNLQEWAIHGVPPPPGAVLALDATFGIRRDEYGNAIGGLRSPDIEAPIAAYRGAYGSFGVAALAGAKVPFDADVLRRLYPTRADYLAKVTSAVESCLAARTLLAEDGRDIIARAERANLF